MSTPPLRLQKFLSQVGICSRREAEQWMRDGRVRVNGHLATEPGVSVNPDQDVIEVDGKTVEDDGALLYLAIHKPVGVITSTSDPEGRPVITSLLPPWADRARPVGRLDWSTDGLLLMTNDGRLTFLMTHPSHNVEKVYQVKVKGLINHQDPTLDQLRLGVTLDDGFHTSSCQVEVIRQTDQYTWLELILHEGHNRQIRRMCEAVGYQVQRLRRVAIGPLELGDIPPGAFRLLTVEEILALYLAAGERAPRNLNQRLVQPPQEKPVKSDKKPAENQNKPRLTTADNRKGGHGERPRRDDRAPQGDRPPRRDNRDERPPRRDDRPPRRDDRDDRAPQGQRPPRRDDRAPQGDRPPRRDNSAPPRRDDRAPRDERPPRRDNNRDNNAPRGDRPPQRRDDNRRPSPRNKDK